MRKISKFLVLSAILAGIFGATFQKSKSVVKTEAADITNNVKLYLEPGVWDVDNAWFAAYFFGDGDEWKKMEKEDDIDRYKIEFTTTKKYTNVIFTRMDPGKPALNWDSKWGENGQTPNEVYDGVNDVFYIKGWSYGAWKSSKVLTPTTAGINSNKVRIWLDRNDHYENGFQFSMKIGNSYYQPTGHEGAINEGRHFAYYDMPTSLLSGSPNINFVAFDNDGKQHISTSPLTYATGDNNIIWKVNYEEGNWTLSKGAITERITASFLAKVLEGYLTCSPSTENGYNAFPAIEANFIPRDVEGNMNLEGHLGTQALKDYIGTGTTGYGSDRGEGVEVMAWDKYQALQNLYNAGQIDSADFGTKINESRNTTGVALLVLTLGIALFGGFYFLYKKKFVIR